LFIVIMRLSVALHWL